MFIHPWLASLHDNKTTYYKVPNPARNQGYKFASPQTQNLRPMPNYTSAMGVLQTNTSSTERLLRKRIMSAKMGLPVANRKILSCPW